MKAFILPASAVSRLFVHFGNKVAFSEKQHVRDRALADYQSSVVEDPKPVFVDLFSHYYHCGGMAAVEVERPVAAVVYEYLCILFERKLLAGHYGDIVAVFDLSDT